jgi:hypothetical protein
MLKAHDSTLLIGIRKVSSLGVRQRLKMVLEGRVVANRHAHVSEKVSRFHYQAARNHPIVEVLWRRVQDRRQEINQAQ